jgi:signal transduction histidine kinase
MVKRHGDLLLAVALTLAAELEVLLGPGDGRLVRALAVPIATLPLARRRDLPLLPLAAVAVTMFVQAVAADFFEAGPAVPLVVMVIALYSAGRYVRGAWAVAAAAVVAAALAAIRIAFDPDVDDVGAAAVTVIAVALALLIGRWVHGQERLHRELEATAVRRERERERDAREAAEEERMRIATDLQAAVAERLAETVEQASRLRRRLTDGDEPAARELLASIAAAARESLADVRRVLGILRRDGDAPLAPPGPPDASPAARPPAADDPSRVPMLPADDASRVPQPSAAAGARRAPSSPAVTGAARPRALAPATLDRLLVAAILAGAELELLLTVSAGDRAFAIVSPIVIAAPLLWRRRHPVPVALGVLAAVAVQSTVLNQDSFAVANIAALVCAAYTMGAFAPRRAAIAGFALFALGDAAHSAVFHPDAVPIALFGGVAVPWTVGRIVRAQRRLTAEAHEQAIQVERARERDARAAVTAERMRVARELHDAVAHNISVIAIQAAGAEGVLARDRARAEECAALIEEVGRDAIAELRRLAGTPEGPQPTLARVDALAQRTRDGGLPVDLRVEGDPAGLSTGVDLAAFRIVQEALANASKHAGAARAWVVVRYERRAIELEIGDDGPGPDAAGRVRNGTQPHAPAGTGTEPTSSAGTSGHGLVGMRERVALYGGTLDVGRRPGGGFAVRARLPLEGA